MNNLYSIFIKQKLRSNVIKFIDKYEKLFIFFLIFIIYSVNFRLIGSGDTVPASLLPFSILENNNLYFDQFISFFHNPPNTLYFFTEQNGHYLSFFPIVTPILVTPLYIIPYIFLKLIHYPIDMYNPGFSLVVAIMEKSSASVIAALSGVFVFLSLKELINKKTAIIGTMVYAFATNTWTIGSQGLWQHGMVELLLSMIIYFVVVNERKEENRNFTYLGILSGLFIFNRPPDSVLLLPVLFYTIYSAKPKVIRYFCSLLLASLPFLLYNFYYFGDIFGGYNNNLNILTLKPETLIHFIGLLISPSRGLFVYSPILLLSVLGYLKVSRIVNKRIKIFLFIFGFSIILNILVYSSFWHWWAGWSYGPRFLTGMLPILIIFTGLYLNDYINFNMINKKKILSICIILILLIWSIFVQIVGVFYYPSGGWDANPNVDLHPERLWDWKDTQIMRSFNAGIAGVGNPVKDFFYILESKKFKDIINNGSISTGWYGLENWGGTPTRWIENNGTIKMYFSEGKKATIALNVTSFYRPRILQVYINDKLELQTTVSSWQELSIRADFIEGDYLMRFYTPDGCQRPIDIPELNNSDSRCLSLAFQNITIT